MLIANIMHTQSMPMCVWHTLVIPRSEESPMQESAAQEEEKHNGVSSILLRKLVVSPRNFQ